jgi:hypothetical protein
MIPLHYQGSFRTLAFFLTRPKGLKIRGGQKPYYRNWPPQKWFFDFYSDSIPDQELPEL